MAVTPLQVFCWDRAQSTDGGLAKAALRDRSRAIHGGVGVGADKWGNVVHRVIVPIDER